MCSSIAAVIAFLVITGVAGRHAEGSDHRSDGGWIADVLCARDRASTGVLARESERRTGPGAINQLFAALASRPTEAKG